MLKKVLSIILSVAMVSALLVGCTTKQGEDKTEAVADGTKENGTGKLKIITTLFPQYDFTKQIVGDKAEVTLLLPPGTESHSFEPTPADMIGINDSDLFIYTGEFMEVWATQLIEDKEDKDKSVLDVSKGITLEMAYEEHDDHGEHDDHDEHKEEADDHHDETKDAHDEDSEHHNEKDEAHDTDEDHHEEGEEHHDADEHHEEGEEHHHLYDPHIWTNPHHAMIMVDNIVEAICNLDPDNAEYYKNNASQYKEQLVALDKEIRTVVENATRDEIVHGGRNAFYYFFKEYGLKVHAAYDSCSTETEPSTKVVANLIDEIKEEKIPVIFYQELSTPQVAQTISSETGAKMLLLHSAHNVSKKDFEAGVTYISLMEQNAKNLKEALK